MKPFFTFWICDVKRDRLVPPGSDGKIGANALLSDYRDEAMRQTRLLQNQILAENEKVGRMMGALPR